MMDGTGDAGALGRTVSILAKAGRDLQVAVATVQRAAEAEELRALLRSSSPEFAATQIRALIATRRLWHNAFELGDSDPAWALLMELFATRLEGETATVDVLGWATDLEQATAARWIGRLESQGLVARGTQGEDKRRLLVTLTDEGEDKLRAYLAAALRLSPWLV
jgi:hypothetical protein